MGARSPEIAPRVVRFGVFEVDFAAGELRKLGHRLKLEALPFRVLTLLVRRPGELVTRDELRQELWPDGTFVEFDDGLNTAVKKLRGALGDSPRDSRFIETVPRQGYRFIAPVGQASQVIVQQTPLEPLAVRTRRRIRLWAVASVLVAGLAAVWVWVRASDVPEGEPRVVPLTSYEGAEFQPTLSPDGTRVAFSWNGEHQDNFDIYVKVVGEERPLRLTTSGNKDGSPAWSPNGRSIAFLRDLDEKVGVFLISPQGGQERQVAVLKGEVNLEKGAPPAWTPDGEWLIVPDEDLTGEPLGLFIVSVESGVKQRLTRPPSGLWGDAAPAISPDGERLMFCRQTDGLRNGDLYLLPLGKEYRAAGEPVRITFANQFVGKPVWTANGKEVIFTTGRQHSYYLHRMVASPGSKPWHLSFAGVNSSAPSVAGRRLAFARAASDADFYRLDLRSAGDGAMHPVRLSSSTLVDHLPQFSPDGQRIAFSSWRTGSPEVWVCDKDGRNLLQLTSLGIPAVDYPTWSPDGSQIVFSASGPSGHRICVVNSLGGGLRHLDCGQAVPGAPSWSRNGKWIYFDSDRTSHREIWRVPAGGGEAVPVTRNGGGHGRESPDGRRLYYLKPHRQGKIGSASLWGAVLSTDGRTGDEGKLVDSISNQNFEVLEQGVYYIAETEGAPSSIRFYEFATGKNRKVYELPREAMWGFSVSSDGRSLLYTLSSINSDLALVENFE